MDFGSYQGHGIYAKQEVAKKIEKQTRYDVEHRLHDFVKFIQPFVKSGVPFSRRRLDVRDLLA